MWSSVRMVVMVVMMVMVVMVVMVMVMVVMVVMVIVMLGMMIWVILFMMITSGMISERTRRSTRVRPRALVSFIFLIDSYSAAR